MKEECCKWTDISETDAAIKKPIRKFDTSCGTIHLFLEILPNLTCPYCGKEITFIGAGVFKF